MKREINCLRILDILNTKGKKFRQLSSGAKDPGASLEEKVKEVVPRESLIQRRSISFTPFTLYVGNNLQVQSVIMQKSVFIWGLPSFMDYEHMLLP